MELRQYFNVFRKWLWLIALGALLAGGTAFVVSVLSTPVYQSSVTLLISQGADPNNVYGALITSNTIAPTYVEQIKSPVVLNQVIRDLNLPFNAGELKGATTVQQIRNTQLIQIAVEDAIPERAQAVANGLANAFIQITISTQQARFQVALKEIDQQVADVKKKIDDTQKALAPLGNLSDPKNLSAPEFVRTEQMRLQMELSTYQAQYTVLLKSAQDFRLAASRYVDSVAVSSPAELPEVPVRPRILLNTLLGFVVGLMLGVGAAFLIEYLDDTAKSSEDVTRVLGLDTLGNVSLFPKAEKLASGLVTVEVPLAPFTEAYRNLRTNLQFALLGQHSSALVVTSAMPGEGKSTTLANLAVVMAQLGKKVILVDTDLRRPTLHEFFGVPKEPGLTNVLIGDIQNLDSVLTETKVPNLRVLSSGKHPPNPAELLASDLMGKLIEVLKNKADYVLFDAPPILPVSDALLLAAKTGNILLVVGAGETRTEALRKAKESLQQVNAKVLGVVLNRITRGHAYGYPYYYHYYYSEDGQRHEKHRGALGWLDALQQTFGGASRARSADAKRAPTPSPEPLKGKPR